MVGLNWDHESTAAKKARAPRIRAPRPPRPTPEEREARSRRLLVEYQLLLGMRRDAELARDRQYAQALDAALLAIARRRERLAELGLRRQRRSSPSSMPKSARRVAGAMTDPPRT
jgi:hypothetical protein